MYSIQISRAELFHPARVVAPGANNRPTALSQKHAIRFELPPEIPEQVHQADRALLSAEVRGSTLVRLDNAMITGTKSVQSEDQPLPMLLTGLTPDTV